jgi:hypothetical protein
MASAAMPRLSIGRERNQLILDTRNSSSFQLLSLYHGAFPFRSQQKFMNRSCLRVHASCGRVCSAAVYERPHTGHTASSPRCIAITRCRVRRSLRHRRDLHRPEQNTASAAIDTSSGSLHSRQYRRADPPSATNQIIQP